jgi:hypothetical protein
VQRAKPPRHARAFPIRHWQRARARRNFAPWQWSASTRSFMRFLLVAEGLVAIVAAIASYLSGYLDGRADIRAMREKMCEELRDFD